MGEDEPTIGDVSVMIDAKFITGTCDGILDCMDEADINQSGGASPDCEDVTIGDISILIDYLFIIGQRWDWRIVCRADQENCLRPRTTSLKGNDLSASRIDKSSK